MNKLSPQFSNIAMEIKKLVISWIYHCILYWDSVSSDTIVMLVIRPVFIPSRPHRLTKHDICSQVYHTKEFYSVINTCTVRVQFLYRATVSYGSKFKFVMLFLEQPRDYSLIYTSIALRHWVILQRRAISAAVLIVHVRKCIPGLLGTRLIVYGISCLAVN